MSTSEVSTLSGHPLNDCWDSYVAVNPQSYVPSTEGCLLWPSPGWASVLSAFTAGRCPLVFLPLCVVRGDCLTFHVTISCWRAQVSFTSVSPVPAQMWQNTGQVS